MSGSRIPPSAFPYRSRCTVLNSGVVAIGFPDGGGTPWVIHLRSATSAASSSSNTPMLSGWVAPFDTTPNTHWGAVSCGFSRRIAPASYRPSCRSMCAAPASSQVRRWALSGCRADATPSSSMSPSVLSWMNGVALSVRIKAGNGENATRPLPIGAARADPADVEEPVEGVAERLDRVHVRDHPERRLRVTRADDRGRPETPEQVRGVRPGRLGRLGEDVVGLPVVAVS